MRRGNKFHAIRTKASDGKTFDSRAEARRYEQLRLLIKTGQITDLQLHPSYKFEIDGQRLKCDSGRSVEYRADFAYTDAAGARVVEDVKSPATRTPQYKIKRALMKAVLGVHVIEVP
ncbi:MAG: hypothetical protein VR70_05945 [Rhodospirillaceae bacterium BRH_c57]|nr:MAG: hypothetical protein VR70_05945 [Rhodospirillaceae bacterium BRH_c57]